MSYDTVRNGIANLLKLQGITESNQLVDFKDAPSSEYGNTYLLKCVSGEQAEADSDTLVNKFYDFQKWQIKIAFERSTHSEKANYDDMHRVKDTVINSLDNPSNWASYVRIQKVISWNVEETDNYFVLTIELKVIDTYTY